MKDKIDPGSMAYKYAQEPNIVGYMVVSPMENGNGTKVFVRFDNGQPVINTNVFHGMRFEHRAMAEGLARELGQEWKVADLREEPGKLIKNLL